tara:strand:- start:3625 stop:4830 length:1206 start_codon:yes stop_codon:yes gene_type:complete
MNVAIWPGSSSFAPGATPFGFYDAQPDFDLDADKVADFCARRMGYPLVDIELQSGSFYTAFEEAVTTYGNELYAYKVRDNQLTLEGLKTESGPLNEAIITPSFEPIVRLTEMYGAEAGSGGNVPYYSGSFGLTSSIQDYSFQTFMSSSKITSSLGSGSKAFGDFGIEIKRVFYQEPLPASAILMDPYNGFGFGGAIAAGIAGVGGFGGGEGFLMMPLNYDLQVIQSIDMNRQVRRSNYSFEVRNDKLRIFPIPNFSGGNADGCERNIWFEYIIRSERIEGSVKKATELVTNVSNTPYTNPNYDHINSIGRQWIFEYTLALSKEMLGYVRGKYSSIPIPNAEVNLNQGDLLSAATAEKTALLERLRNYFDETSRQALLNRRASEAESKMIELQQVPYTIYVA